MKRLLSYKLIILLLAVGFVSCEDEDTIRIPFDDIERTVNMRIQVNPEFSFFDALDVPNAFIQMSFFTENTNIQQVELFVDFFSFELDSTFERATLLTFTQSDFDAEGTIRDVVVTSQDVADALGITVDDIGGGDRLDLFNFTTLTDGRVFPDSILAGTDFDNNINVTPNIINNAATTSFTTQITVFVACAVDPAAWEGDYLTNVVDLQDPNGFDGVFVSTNLPSQTDRLATITFVGTPEPFRFNTSDCCANFWELTTGAGGAAQPGPFFNICETPLLQGGNSSGFGDHNGTGGSRDPATGEIRMEWFNFFNPVGGTTVYTPN